MPKSTDNDPFYQDATSPFGWVRREAARRGIGIKVLEDLTRPGYTSPDGSTVYARPALSFPTYHWLIACSVIASVFGPDIAPDLEVGDPPIVTTSVGGGVILPFQRRISGPVAGGMRR